MMKYGIIFLMFAFFMGCAVREKLKMPENKERGTAVQTSNVTAGKYDESFDPLTLEDDDITIQRQDAGASRENPQGQRFQPSASTARNVSDSLTTYKEVDGFRVQIFAGRDIQTATLTEAQAKEVFAKEGLKVYLIFEAPFYKVRVGDFTDRDAAQNARELARSLGFRSAFVVGSKVKVPVH